MSSLIEISWFAWLVGLLLLGSCSIAYHLASTYTKTSDNFKLVSAVMIFYLASSIILTLALNIFDMEKHLTAIFLFESGLLSGSLLGMSLAKLEKFNKTSKR